MNRITIRKFKAISFYVLSWVFSCLLLTAFYFYYDPNLSLKFSFLLAVQYALLLGLSHGIYDVIVLEDNKDHRSIWIALLIRSSYFLTAIAVNVTICVFIWSLYDFGDMISEESFALVATVFASPITHLLILYSFIMGYLITFVRSVHKKFGTRVFINTLLGKYQDPTEEERVFMLVDLKNSTNIAEELGHFKYSEFLRDYYRYLSNCCEENHGEIYQIAGDGAYLTWSLRASIKNPRPVLCFYDLMICLNNTRRNFLRKYSVAPSCKAAIHCGKVIVSEVGNFGSEIAYHGDVINTTARLETLCSKIGQDLICSECFIEKVNLKDYYPQKQGTFELKGKKKTISVYSLHFSLDKENT
jgi:adenylate cyclase